MGIPQVDINYLSVFIAAVVSMIIGGLWHSPILFGNLWMKLSKISKKDIAKGKKKSMGKTYLAAFITMLVMSFVLAHFVKYVTAQTILDALQLGLWVWLGFIITILINNVLWECKPVKLYLFNIIFHLVSIEVMSIILTRWQ